MVQDVIIQRRRSIRSDRMAARKMSNAAIWNDPDVSRLIAAINQNLDRRTVLIIMNVIILGFFLWLLYLLAKVVFIKKD